VSVLAAQLDATKVHKHIQERKAYVFQHAANETCHVSIKRHTLLMKQNMPQHPMTRTQLQKGQQVVLHKKSPAKV
jgi:hypothetical protein